MGTQTVLNGLGPIKRLLGKCFQTSMSLTDGKFSRRKQWIMSSELRWDEAAWCLASSSSPGVHLSSSVCPQSMRWMTEACDDNNVLLRGQEKHSICQTSHDPWTRVYFLLWRLLLSLSAVRFKSNQLWNLLDMFLALSFFQLSTAMLIKTLPSLLFIKLLFKGCLKLWNVHLLN